MTDHLGNQYFGYTPGGNFGYTGPGVPQLQTPQSLVGQYSNNQQSPAAYALQQFGGGPQSGQFNAPTQQQINAPTGGNVRAGNVSYSPQNVSAGSVSAGNVSAGKVGNVSVPGMARVASPQTQQMANFNYNGSPVDPAVQAQILQSLQNPSAYTSQMAQDTYNRLNTSLSQGYDVQRQRADENMASRGLFSSTPALGRLGDLGIQQARAQADLAGNITTQAAQQYQSDRNSAIAAAMGYQGQQFGQQASGYGLNQQTANQNFNQNLGVSQFGLAQNQAAAQHALGIGGLNMQGQVANAQMQLSASQANASNRLSASGQNANNALQAAGINNSSRAQAAQVGLDNARLQMQAQGMNFDQSMAGAQFGAQQNQSAYNNALNSYQANLQGNQQNYAQGLGTYQTNLGAQQQNFNQQQQGFENQFNTNQFNAGLAQQDVGNQLNAAQFGLQSQGQGFNQQYNTFGMNQQQNQQNFNQQQTLLNNLLGYNQQQWQNNYNNTDQQGRLLAGT